MKYSNLLGIIAAICLIIFCFSPWAYYPDIKENFTGFYSYQNQYGKPGKVLVFLSAIAILFFLIPKIWAKRINQFVSVLIFAYGGKTFMLFAGSYNAIHPQIKPGLIIMIVCGFVILLCSLLSKVNLKSGDEQTVKKENTL